MTTDYYEILGVDKNASKDEIKSAFRKKARIYHPDVNKEPDAEAKFKELGKAYETLMDDNKRATYDRYGEDGLKNAGFDTNGPFASGFGDLNDIFESFFGGGFGFSSGFDDTPNSVQHGADLRLDIVLDFKEAIFGVEKSIEIQHLEKCDNCNGTGAKPGTEIKTCSKCGGTGRVKQVTQTILGSFAQVTVCPVCKGTGKENVTPCPKCHGDGRIEVTKTINVKIPAGVDTGSKIRISNEGNAGKNGGQTGDFYLVIHVKESDKFKRQDNDIFSELKITFPQAALGDTIDVETLDGVKSLTIPQGIEYGKVLTIKGCGVPYIGNNSKRGDHHFVINIVTPSNMSEDEKQLYQKLFELNCNKKPTEKILDKMKKALHN